LTLPGAGNRVLELSSTKFWIRILVLNGVYRLLAPSRRQFAFWTSLS
jgi:hypothetical protein